MTFPLRIVDQLRRAITPGATVLLGISGGLDSAMSLASSAPVREVLSALKKAEPREARSLFKGALEKLAPAHVGVLFQGGQTAGHD